MEVDPKTLKPILTYLILMFITQFLWFLAWLSCKQDFDGKYFNAIDNFDNISHLFSSSCPHRASKNTLGNLLMALD